MNTRPWRTTGPGDTSSAVTGIQFLLRAHGHAIATDGTYGASTQAAVTTFQNSAGLPADGIVGPTRGPHSLSRPSLARSATRFGPYSSSGSLRRRGMTHSRSTAPSGRSPHLAWSPSRPRWGLSVDGVAGQETWSFLSTSSPGPRPWPLVRQGATQATNWRVLAAQHLLRARGAGLAADGSFGTASGAAVRAFQLTLRATDIGTTLGQLDWPHLILTVRSGDHGEAVRAVQTLLPGGLAVDGIFGAPRMPRCVISGRCSPRLPTAWSAQRPGRH